MKGVEMGGLFAQKEKSLGICHYPECLTFEFRQKLNNVFLRHKIVMVINSDFKYLGIWARSKCIFFFFWWKMIMSHRSLQNCCEHASRLLFFLIGKCKSYLSIVPKRVLS